MKAEGRTRFSEFLRHLRKARNLSQYELAKRLGVSQTYIYEFEKGRRGAPPLVHVLRLAQALDLSKDESRELMELAADERTDGTVFQVVLEKNRQITALEDELRSAAFRGETEPVVIGQHRFELPPRTEIPLAIREFLRQHPELHLTSGQLLSLVSLRGRGW